MTPPRITITRHKPGVYEWAVIFDQAKLAGEIGDTSISECLASALAALPDDEETVEVSYRGVGMGTFAAHVVSELPEFVAEQITARYAGQRAD